MQGFVHKEVSMNIGKNVNDPCPVCRLGKLRYVIQRRTIGDIRHIDGPPVKEAEIVANLVCPECCVFVAAANAGEDLVAVREAQITTDFRNPESMPERCPNGRCGGELVADVSRSLGFSVSYRYCAICNTVAWVGEIEVVDEGLLEATRPPEF